MRLGDASGPVVGRIMRHPQAPEDQPWFWTITAREQPPSVYNRGYAASREQAMRYFKARYIGPSNNPRLHFWRDARSNQHHSGTHLILRISLLCGKSK